MGLLTIDTDKCKKDAMCVSECPMKIIQLQEGNGCPHVIPEDENVCTRCGHCVAVCPHGALSHREIDIQDCPPIRKEITIDEEQAIQFLRSRRSIRLYQEKSVEKEKIQKLIEVARYAPTAGNSQLVQWVVLTDRSTIKEIAGLTADWLRRALQDDPRMAAAVPYLPKIVTAWDDGYDSVLRNAPVLIAASAPREARNGMVDVALALCYLDLAAPTMGLGTCWAGLLQGALLSSPALKEVLGIPAEHPHHYPMMLGYTKVKYHRLPERKPPRIVFRGR